MKQEYKTLKDFIKIISLYNNPHIEELSVTEIARKLDMYPSKVSRMLSTLEAEEFIQRDLKTSKYRLGIGFFTLGMAYIFNLPLRKIVRPHIEQIARELNMTVSWAILRNSSVIVVDRVQNLNIDLLTYRLGLNVPIHCTSLGKILLAYLPPEKRKELLDSVELKRFTANTIVDPRVIEENLKLSAERGYAVDEAETHADLNCLAVPIRNGTGEVIAAINIMDERSRNNPEKFFQLADYLKGKAFFISRQLGYGATMVE